MSYLVFDGDQGPALFRKSSSLAAVLHSLMACLALATANGTKKIGKINIRGTLIHTEMNIVEVFPGIKKSGTPFGKLYCRLFEALCGCIQAKKFWFNKLTEF